MRARALFAAAAVAALLGCPKKETATEAECSALYSRFLDLKLAEDRRFAHMSEAERAAARAQAAASVASDPDVAQVNTQCRAEVTRTEYECAIKANTAREWNDCIQ
jgi:hypothetical protein